MLLTRSPLRNRLGYPHLFVARLACIRHAASVRPEPGSNSPTYILMIRHRLPEHLCLCNWWLHTLVSFLSLQSPLERFLRGFLGPLSSRPKVFWFRTSRNRVLKPALSNRLRSSCDCASPQSTVARPAVKPIESGPLWGWPVGLGPARRTLCCLLARYLVVKEPSLLPGRADSMSALLV